ncbi:YdcF family protein [Mucilaginibacter sp.]|uniref:YdcF family protein n=1 Tax=Mucilaginibacter sp. TaxID=1882438 RepID=UPI00260C0E57|nr:YdcF family protein [Mucilaginibacter sp.]MDB5030144.1 YdcF family protein [Mucilaginibacter sp.]
MYFIFSKILLFLILPIYWIIILLVIALVSKERKRKRKFLIAAVIVFYLFSNPLLLNTFQRIWDVRATTINKATKYSCVIVLGGFSSSGGQDGGHFNTAADRFIQGIKLLATKQASHILISGGNGNLLPGGFREAAWVKTQLTELNIPDSLILIENNSKNTIENAKFSKMLLSQTHLPPPYLLVTSAFHMRRSLMIFKKAGIDVVPYPCNFFGTNNHFVVSDFIPDSATLFNWESYTKEVVGYAVNYFK